MLPIYLERIYTPQLYFIGICILALPFLVSPFIGFCVTVVLAGIAHFCDIRTFQSVPAAFKSKDEKSGAYIASLGAASFMGLLLWVWSLCSGASLSGLLFALCLKIVVPTVFAFYAFRSFELNQYPAINDDRMKRRQLEEARIELRRFYEAHIDDLREHIPPALFRARMKADIKEAGTIEEAWRATAGTLEKLNVITTHARELRRKEEERRKKDLPAEKFPEQALIDDLVATLKMGMDPNVIANSLLTLKQPEGQPTAQILDQTHFHKP